MFLISIADKRVEIETGYGIENILADAEVARIIDSKITTQYKQGNFDRGTLEGVKALVYSLESPANTQDNLKRIFNIGIENCN